MVGKTATEFPVRYASARVPKSNPLDFEGLLGLNAFGIFLSNL
jgi:hypothetical protein